MSAIVSNEHQATLQDLFSSTSSSDSLLLLDSHQLAHVAQLVFREDTLDPKLRLKVYEFILNDGQMLPKHLSEDEDDDDEGESDEPFKAVYSRHKNSVRGLNDEVVKLIDEVLTVASVSSASPLREQLKWQEQGETLTKKITDELCGLCEHLASRLELTATGAAGFITSTVLIMFFAVAAASSSSSSSSSPSAKEDTETTLSKNNNNNNNSATKLPSDWSTTVFKLSFQFAEKHKYVLLSAAVTTTSANSNGGINSFGVSTSAASPPSTVKNNRNVSLILLRLILQYHLPELMRHCDQYQMPLCDWILDLWLLNQMRSLLFFCATQAKDDDDKERCRPVSFNCNLLPFVDFIIAARDPLITFALAAQALAQNQSTLKTVIDKDKFKEAFFSASASTSPSALQTYSSTMTQQQPRVVMLHAQQLLRSTPRCAKNRLRHYLHGTRLLYPLPANNMNEQPSVTPAPSSEATTSQSSSSSSSTTTLTSSSSSSNVVVVAAAAAAAVGGGAAVSALDERELYESQVVLPVSNTELVEAFAMSMQDDGFSVNSSRKVSGNKNDSDFDHHLRPLSFVILDCRSERSFHFARLPTAIHIGADVGYDPELMQAMIERFEGARGSHMCVLGTGRGVPEEANLLKIIALRFVQAGFPYVSIAEEGFKGLIPMIKQGKVEVVKSVQSPAAASPPAAAASTQQQQSQSQSQSQQQHSSPPSTNATASNAKKTADDLLKKAEETAKEAKEAAAKWGKSLMSKFSGWSLGGGSKAPATAATSSTTTSDPSHISSSDHDHQANGGPATKPGDDAVTKKKQPATSVVAGRQELASTSSSSQQQETEEHSQQTFHAGGTNDNEEDDDDELLSQLVTTVVAAPQQQQQEQQQQQPQVKQEEKPAPLVAALADPSPDPNTQEHHHPFDELFGDE